MTLQARWQRSGRPGAPLVVAHRGAWGTAPENTLAAFEAAIALGADMIEFDVRRTGDGRLVVCHDPTFDGLPLAGVRRTALPDDGVAPAGLGDVLALARDRISVNVEFKERYCLAEAVPLLERFGVDRCLCTSFHDDVIREAKAALPALTTGLLVGGHRGVPDLFPSALARRAGADVLVVHDLLADTGILGRAGMPCLVWTVNRPRRLERRLSDPRVVGVITDAADLALRIRAEVSGRPRSKAVC